jgi:hypothetical protein
MKPWTISLIVAGLALAAVCTVTDPVWQFGVALGCVLALLGGIGYLESEGL